MSTKLSLKPPIDQLLFEQGLSLQAVLPVCDVDIALPDTSAAYEQLLVFGHGGQGFWQGLPKPLSGNDPIDEFATRLVTDFFARIDCADYQVLYPSADYQIDLRSLGRQLGWHADTPLGIGINETFGTWFAYRAVVLANTTFEPASVTKRVSPCDACADKPCIRTCPVGAAGSSFDLKACLKERVRTGSSCDRQCLARNACPVGKAHRYERDQMDYHYRASLQMIQALGLA